VNGFTESCKDGLGKLQRARRQHNLKWEAISYSTPWMMEQIIALATRRALDRHQSDAQRQNNHKTIFVNIE